MGDGDEVRDAEEAYGQLRPLYERLVGEITHALQEKFLELDIRPVSLTGRAKDVASFVEKSARKNYSKPLEQTTDCAGIRIVCAYANEVNEIAEAIESIFFVHETVDKARDLGVDRMGYNGRAFVVCLGEGYSGPRYNGIIDLKCEIQIRTILQDAWAIIDHQLVYKYEETTPERLRRDLNNVASLLEIAQGIFDNLRYKRDEYISEIKHKKKNIDSFLAQPIDFDTVMEYTKWKFPNYGQSSNITQILLRDIDTDRYVTLGSIDSAVERAKVAVGKYRRENPNVFRTGTDFITKSLGFVDLDFRSRHGFYAKTLSAFDRYSHLLN